MKKHIIFTVIFLTVLSLAGMDVPIIKTTKKSTSKKCIVIKNEGYREPSAFLTQDILQDHILMRLNLRQISRLGRTCKIFFDDCNFSCICDTDNACRRSIISDYNKTMKVSAYFAFIKDAEMFEVITKLQPTLHQANVQKWSGKSSLTLDKQMEMYRKNCARLSQVRHNKKYQLREAIETQSYSLLQDILKMTQNDESFDIFILFKKFNQYNHMSKLENIFKKLCYMSHANKDSSLLLLLMPKNNFQHKIIALKCLFKFGTDRMLCKLYKSKYIPVHYMDNNQSNALHYAVASNFKRMIQLLLKSEKNLLYLVNKWNHPPLYLACLGKNNLVIRLLHDAYDPKKMTNYLKHSAEYMKDFNELRSLNREDLTGYQPSSPPGL